LELASAAKLAELPYGRLASSLDCEIGGAELAEFGRDLQVIYYDDRSRTISTAAGAEARVEPEERAMGPVV